MRYIASLILAWCLVSPAFAGQEFCQIANPGACVSQNEAQASRQADSVPFPNPGLGLNGASQHHEAPIQANFGEYAFLDLDLMNLENPSTPR